MRLFRLVMLMVLAVGLTACAPSKFKTYNGPEVTQVYVSKSARKIYLLHGQRVLKSYDVDLGFSPGGHKAFEGDGRTPEGAYVIDRRNPNSQFHLSIGISYPNANDIAVAQAAGQSPGGEIFVHGQAGHGINRRDWTAGCIAVTDKEIERIYAMVRNGTPIFIAP